MLEIINKITEGNGTEEELDLLKDTAETISIASLCALGKTAPNPVLSTIKYFPSGKGHILTKKRPQRLRRLRRPDTLQTEGVEKNIKRMLPYG